MIFLNTIHFSIGSETFVFRTVTPDDVDETYVEALRNQSKYISSRTNSTTINLQKEYIQNILSSHHNSICGLFIDKRLLGTSGIQQLKRNANESTTMGVFVLDPQDRGRGYGKAIIWASTKLASIECQINKMEAGLMIENTPSLKAFLSCGFKVISENNGIGRVSLDIENLKLPNNIKNFEIV